MGKTVTYFIVALAIILGLTYMATQAESCANKNPTSIHVNDLDANKESDDIVEDIEEEDDDEEPADEHNDAVGSTISDEDADDDEVIPIDGTEPEYTDESDTDEEIEAEIASKGPEQLGDYLVIAGAFKNETNAKNEVEKLKNMGYPNAEIVEFDYSDFYSVCVARYENSNDAEKVANSIKNRLGKKAYVHKKRSVPN